MSEIWQDAPWWQRRDGEDPGARMVPLVKSLLQQQATRYSNMRKLAAIVEYGYGAADSGIYTASGEPPLEDRRLFFNAAQNAIDTLVTKVCGPKIVPMATTEGGTYAARQKARDLSQCVEGQWDECSLDALKEDVVADAAIYGVGWLKALPARDWSGLKFERVLALDMVIDETEGRYRTPTCLYHRQVVDRFVAHAEFGEPSPELFGSAKKRADKIRRAPAAARDDISETSPHQIEIFEAWHLPSRAPDPHNPEDKGSGDGLHVIAIDGATLFVEEWTEARFPFAAYIPRQKRVGFYGLSTARQLAAGQREFERLAEKIQRAHRRMGGSHIIASRQAKVNVREITNGQGTIIEVDGPPDGVRDWTPTPVNPQTYSYFQSIPEMMLRFMGMSPYAAQSQIPAQLQQASGKALDLFEAQDDKRLMLWHTALERWAVDVVELTKMTVRKVLEHNKDFSVRYNERTGYRRINWKDVIDVDHAIRIFPVGGLSQNPAHKIAQLTTLLNVGAITPEQFRRLYGLPDLEAENNIDEADTDIIDRNLDRMVMTGKYLSPEPFDNLQLIILRGGKFYNMCRVHEVPDERLELIRNYIADAKALMQPPPEAMPEPDAGPQDSGPMPPEGEPPPAPDGGGAGPIPMAPGGMA